MALKKWAPDFAYSGNKVTPDEVGWDQMYYIINPAVSAVFVGTTAIGGTAASRALVMTNGQPMLDYPRNLMMGVQGTNATSGTWVVNGYDQFGNTIQESGTCASSTAGGTVQGTKVFAEVTSGTFNFSSGSVGNGTPKLGVGTGGTTALFGLPAKLGKTTDVKMISGSYMGQGTQTMGTFIGSATVAANVDTANHSVKAPFDVPVGTSIYAVRYRPSYVVNDETVQDTA